MTAEPNEKIEFKKRELSDVEKRIKKAREDEIRRLEKKIPLIEAILKKNPRDSHLSSRVRKLEDRKAHLEGLNKENIFTSRIKVPSRRIRPSHYYRPYGLA